MTLDFLPRILPWVLPPLVGAVIGYITNAVAIRMLFRPLAAKRLFGLRLPLTPGIIPRQRYELAESIGRMVSRELITEEAIQHQLGSASFRRGLRRNVGDLIEEITLKPLASFAGKDRELLLNSLESFLAASLSRFFSSQAFIQTVRELVTRLVGSAAARKPAELLGEQGRQFLHRTLENLLSRLGQPDRRKRLVKKLELWLERQRKQARQLGDFFPEELVQVASGLAAPFLPLLFESLFTWLRREDTRREMEQRGKRLLRDVLDKLNLLQKFLVSATQYDRTLQEKMPEIVTEALDSLEAAAYDNEGNLLEALQRSLSVWREQQLYELYTSLSQKISVSQLLERIAEILARPAVKNRIFTALDSLTGSGQKLSLGQLLGRVFGIQEQELVEYISVQALSTLTRKEFAPEVASVLVDFSRRFLEAHQEQSLQDLLHIEAEGRSAAADFLSDRFLLILVARLPRLIQSFDIQEMVETKINQLDVADVENLLLMVIAKHLKYINLFGALLGALIGLSQLLLGFWQSR
jgi:uncharacterized membrane protein YheB (UPF0754 family)